MSHQNAWLLELGINCRAAVGARELMHLIDVPKTFSVPYTPHYCHRVVAWQGQLLPVMDIAARLGNDSQNERFVAVVAYQQYSGAQPQFAALSLVASPRQISVSDEQACGLPENFQPVSGFAISCFEHQGEAIPVLNLNRLFESAPAGKD